MVLKRHFSNYKTAIEAFCKQTKLPLIIIAPSLKKEKGSYSLDWDKVRKMINPITRSGEAVTQNEDIVAKLN